MINKIDFKAKNLTSNAGLFLLLENAKSNGIFDFIENDLVFDNDSTNKIKMNHIKTMLCGHFIGIDKLERLKLLQNDPLVNEFDISVKEPETVSRFLGNFNFKTTQMFRDINFKVFKKLLTKSKLTSITIDIDSSVINVEGHQEGASKGYNPKKLGNRCYNIQFGFAPIFPDTCYHLTHYWLAAVDIPVASDNPVHYADAIRYNARTPLQGSLLPLTRLVWA